MKNNNESGKILEEPISLGISEDKIRFAQSANTLFNFMGQLDHLIAAIEKMEMFPLYFKEDVEYLNLKIGNRSIRKFSFPMLCFCDINMHRLQAHLGKKRDQETNSIIDGYGHFGIGLDKQWCIQKGFQPISYINPFSLYCDEISSVLNTGLRSVFLDEDFNDETFNLLLRQMTLIKPLSGKMDNRIGKELTKNFHDEKEWRFLPNLDNVSSPDFMDDATQAKLFEPVTFNNLNNGMLFEPSVHLKIKNEVIKYLFVDTLNDKDFLISKLLEFYGDNLKLAMDLASKIIVYEEIVEDW